MTLTKVLVPICLYCLKCTKFAPFILRKIIKIVATRCQILRPTCTKFDFDRGSAQTLLRSSQGSPDLLAGFKGPTSKGREMKENGGEARGLEGKERRGEEEGKGRRTPPPKPVISSPN